MSKKHDYYCYYRYGDRGNPVSCDCTSMPRILPESYTPVRALSFEELVVTDGLLAAVLTPGCDLQLSVKDRFIEHFPQTTQLDVLMKKVC